MGAIADQMEALASGVLASSQARSEAVAGMRADTARILSEARALLTEIAQGHREMGEILDRELRGAAAGLTATVTELLRDIDQAHAQRTADLSRFLADHREERSGDLQAFRDAFGEARAETLRQVTDGLQEFADQVRAEVTAFLSGARATRNEGSEAVRERTFGALSALRARVAALAEESAGFLGRCEQTHGEMARQLRQTLSLDTGARRDKVNALREGFRDAQQALAGDLRVAASAWRRVALARAGLAAVVPPRPSKAVVGQPAPDAGKDRAPKSHTRRKKTRKGSASG